MSRWPPRIMAKESAWWKNTVPGWIAMASLPALIMSQSSSPAGAACQRPSTPFSLCRKMSLSRGKWLAISVGRPMPRFTWAPSGMSRATRAAIWLRMSMLTIKTPGLAADQALDEDTGGDHGFRVQLAQLAHPAHRSNGVTGSHGHHRTKVAGGFAIHQVAPAVADFSLDHGVVHMDRVFEHVLAAVDLPGFLALGEQGAVAGGRIEGADAGASGTQALGKVALGYQLELDLAGAIEFFEYVGMAHARKRAEDLPHPASLEERGNADSAVARVVADQRQFAGTVLDQRINQIFGLSGPTKTANGDGCTVLDAGHRIGGTAQQFVDHG